MNIQVKVALEKREHPERFCKHPRCLWRVQTARGPNPCRKHPLPAPTPEAK